jgi:hypothetical protein
LDALEGKETTSVSFGAPAPPGEEPWAERLDHDVSHEVGDDYVRQAPTPEDDAEKNGTEACIAAPSPKKTSVRTSPADNRSHCPRLSAIIFVALAQHFTLLS